MDKTRMFQIKWQLTLCLLLHKVISSLPPIPFCKNGSHTNKDVQVWKSRTGPSRQFCLVARYFRVTHYWSQLSGLSVSIDHNYNGLVRPALWWFQIISLFDHHNWWASRARVNWTPLHNQWDIFKILMLQRIIDLSLPFAYLIYRYIGFQQPN